MGARDSFDQHAARGVDANRSAVRFEHVSLGFEDKVVLKDVSFSLGYANTKIILGASGAGKSFIESFRSFAFGVAPHRQSMHAWPRSSGDAG